MTFKIHKGMIILILISIIATIFIYSSLPEKIPTHWNIRGEIDSYNNKSFVWFTSLLPLGIYMLMIYVPEIDPRRESYKKHKKAYKILMNILVPFFIVVHWITIFSALGHPVSVARIIPIGVGILFIVIGNYMGQIRPNYTFGIRIPWTLADETVWKKTHRVGSFAFILSGLIFIIAGIINKPYSFILAISSIFVTLIFTFVYSYLEYKKIHS
ncbi:MAG: SdpI family protein [Candidatus Caldatribacteriota bacterium]|nr:SdpI family protein [Candidatus Caldatribacteriota bacterium]